MRLYFLVTIAAFALSATAIFLFVGEYRAARLARASDAEVFQTLTESPPPRPGSLYADDRIFLACHKALTGTLARVQPKSALQAIAGYCQAQARQALAAAPSSAHAHYVAALSAAKLGDPATANRELLASQANGRFESWLAKRRFRLALALGRDLASDGRAARDGDVSALLQSPKGRRFLAWYYAARPALHEGILAAAEALGPDVRAGLLNEIRRALNARAGGA